MAKGHEKIIKGNGTNESEKYLKRLCEKTFLSLWSYSNVYREQRIGAKNLEGKELADLLVVCGDDIIIFSDKKCSCPNSGDLETDWNRWYRKAIIKSSEQAWGAERWIREFPDKIFLDKECSQPFPFKLPDRNRIRVHIVLVAHGVSERCKRRFGGSGSLMLHYSPAKINPLPFTISELNKAKTFVHILDDTTLNIILDSLDTISDFLHYLSKKEKLLRSGKTILATGEEELLAYYLQNFESENEHGFSFDDKYNVISLEEGGWEEFQNSPKRLEQIKANEVSYFWDELIEKFSYHIINGTQYHFRDRNVQNSEVVLRFLAQESRLNRRVNSKGFIDFITKSPMDYISRRYIKSKVSGQASYLFLLFPKMGNISEVHYREVRRAALLNYSMVLKNRAPEVEDIVGIALEPGVHNFGKSEDALYIDVRNWSEEDRKIADEFMAHQNISYDEPLQTFIFETEYPSDLSTIKARTSKNKPCFCGSGKKYKRCHGK